MTPDSTAKPLGAPVPGWREAQRPQRLPLEGDRVRLEPLDAERHADDLHAAFLLPGEGPDDTPAARWTYSGGLPFDDADGHRRWLAGRAASQDPLFFAIVERGSGRALGLASYLDIQPEHGAIEIGYLHFTPPLRRTPAATEALTLMMRHAFALGYRRCVWKCDALNRASRSAALRLGFRFEGLFRQHRVVNGHNRDTAWYAVLDGDWPRLSACHARWLDAANFDARGRQRLSLSALTAEALAAPPSDDGRREEGVLR